MSVANIAKPGLGSDPSMDGIGARTKEILMSALDVVSEGTPAAVAVSLALSKLDASDAERVRVQGLFGEALVSVEIGNGRDFHHALLERALALAGESTHRKVKNGPASAGKESKMGDESTAVEAAGEKGSKKYRVGDTFNLVAEMGLLPSGDGADVPFKLSRKTSKDGRVLPAGTPLKYVGAKAVFKDKPSSKRMIFCLDDGTEVAGVVNHIDPDDPYNKKVTKGVDAGSATDQELASEIAA